MNKIVKYLYFLFILIVSMEASIYYNTKTMLMARAILAVTLISIYKIKISKRLMNIMVYWLLFVIICYIFTKNFQPLPLLKYWAIFLEAYLIINLFKTKIFPTFVKFMLVLTIVSLFFWIISHLSMSIVFSILKPFDISGGFRESLGDYIHIIFVTLRNTRSRWTYGLYRNAGFCWEPGPFGIILNFALFFNIFYNKNSFLSVSSMIFILALITTFSTTGWLTFSIWFFLHKFTYSKKPYHYLVSLILIIGFMFAFIRLDFLGLKTEQYVNRDIYVNVKNQKLAVRGSRLSGLPLITQDIINNPIAGKGLLRIGEYDYFGRLESSHLNAIFTIASSMGLFGLFWFVYFFYKSSLYFSDLLKIRNKLIFASMIVVSSFGFNIHSWSIIFIFLLFFYFHDNQLEGNCIRKKQVKKII